MGHTRRKTIKRFLENESGLQINFDIPSPKTVDYNTHAYAKAHEIVSWLNEIKLIASLEAIFHSINQKIIQYDNSYDYYEYATYSQCEIIRYVFTDTHGIKSVTYEIGINHFLKAESLLDFWIKLKKLNYEAFFKSKRWLEFVASEEIVHKVKVPDTLEQNRKAEVTLK